MMKKVTLLFIASVVLLACKVKNEETKNTVKTEKTVQIKKKSIQFPQSITINDIAQNPEGIEFDKNDHTFLLSSLNANPIIKVKLDGTFKPFTSGEKFPLSTAGLQIDYKHNRLLVAGFNLAELMDDKPETKGASFLRIYNLKTGIIEKDINLSSLVPNAKAYFANDVAIDNEGNAYVSDWYAGVIYKVDLEGKPSVFWQNKTGIESGANGLDYHSDGYLLVSLLSVSNKGLYEKYGLVKIPTNSPSDASIVKIETGYTGFDGMVLNDNKTIIGVTNNGKTPGGNTLIKLTSEDNWKTAKVKTSKAITPSTTVAITPNYKKFIINQDFSNRTPKTWTIEQIEF